MRKYAYLKKPLPCSDSGLIYKVMLYQTAPDELYLFEYCARDAVMSSYDLYYTDISDLYDEWNDKTDENGWTDIDDPLPDCQHDAFLPIRIKGRNTGKPEWGSFEILKDGEWTDFIP
jgi:hypothetical protein